MLSSSAWLKTQRKKNRMSSSDVFLCVTWAISNVEMLDIKVFHRHRCTRIAGCHFVNVVTRRTRSGWILCYQRARHSALVSHTIGVTTG